MIKNNKQQRNIQERMIQITNALDELEKQKENIDANLFELNKNALESQLEDLQKELLLFDSLKSGKLKKISIESFAEIYRILISFRIALGWTQRDLASRIGVKEQQIQRYESTDYQSASLHRIIEIINAMDITIDINEVIIPHPLFSFPEGHNERELERKMRRIQERGSVLPIAVEIAV
ncbi:MAG: helix-turn-helix transcriptional regulator [Bacteroidales bacterium]|nr:helix-turn-helix transcriptional regulator [Bacteroidales bacterium]